MQYLDNEDDRIGIINRLDRLKANSKAQWGSMSPNGMICHMADQLAIATGERKTVKERSILATWLGKWLALYVVPWRKGKERAPTEMDQTKLGTPPTSIEHDRQRLRKLLDTFLAMKSKDLGVHPFFGKLNKKDWSRLLYKHFDHHLDQFGI